MSLRGTMTSRTEMAAQVEHAVDHVLLALRQIPRPRLELTISFSSSAEWPPPCAVLRPSA